MTSDSSTLALVESATQLLDVVELAHATRATDELGDLRVSVLAPAPGRGRDQLRGVVALARQEGLSVTWHEPRSGGASVARTIRGLLAELGRARRLVVGDPFSGVLQVLVGLVRPTELTIVDDGTAMLELVRRQAAVEPAHRWLTPGAGTRVRVFTASPWSDPDPGSTGVEVRWNSYAWLRGRWPDPEVLDGVDLVGSPPVEDGDHLARVGHLVARQGGTRYLAHPLEPDDRLAQVRALGVEVVVPRLPLEIELRRGPVGATVISLSSAGAHVLPVVLAGTRVRTLVSALPGGWCAPGAGPAAGSSRRRVSATTPVDGRLASPTR